MAGSSYDFNALTQIETDGALIYTNVGELPDSLTSLTGNLDSRIFEYCNGYISKVRNDIQALSDELNNIKDFNTWISGNNSALFSTNAGVEAIAGSPNTGGFDDSGFGGGAGGSGNAGATGIGGLGDSGFGGGAGGSGNAGAASIAGLGDTDIDPGAIGAGTAGATAIIGLTSTEFGAGGDGEGDINKANIESVGVGIGDAWNNLTPHEQDLVDPLLEKLGFTPDEIKQIKNGTYQINPMTLDEANLGLTNVFGIDPSIRQYIIDKYGFDIFNDDGTINREKLALLLAIDGKDPIDGFDIIGYLRTKYGTDVFLASSGDLTNSGSISHSGTSSRVVASGTIGVGVTAGAVSAGAIASALISQKNKEDEEEEEESVEESEEAKAEEEAEGLYGESKKKKSDKKWLYGLGIGLGAAGMLASDDDDDDEEDEESEEDGSDNFKA